MTMKHSTKRKLWVFLFDLVFLLIAIVLAIILFSGCSYQQHGNGAITSDLGRNAGIIMSSTAEGDMYVVVDQNESRSFSEAMTAVISGMGFSYGKVLSNDKTKRYDTFYRENYKTQRNEDNQNASVKKAEIYSDRDVSLNRSNQIGDTSRAKIEAEAQQE